MGETAEWSKGEIQCTQYRVINSARQTGIYMCSVGGVHPMWAVVLIVTGPTTMRGFARLLKGGLTLQDCQLHHQQLTKADHRFHNLTMFRETSKCLAQRTKLHS